MSRKSVLIIDDATDALEVMRADLEDSDYQVFSASSGEEGLRVLREEDVDFVFVDFAMPGMSGFEVLDAAKAERPGMPIIIMTGHTTLDTALQAIKRGAFDYVAKPFSTEEMLIAAEKASRTVELRRENLRLRQNLDGLIVKQSVVGMSKAMQQVFILIARAASTTATVLIEGETGTGKDLVAQAIHHNSPQSHAPFVVFNCSAYPEDLLESELFGHEKGAFTGAYRQRQGRFELAHKGTLFLDEVSELIPSTQAKLLRVLQQREFERVGGSTTIHVDVRIISATNQSLADKVAQNKFRQDLFFRLNVLHIVVPPLRERLDDITLLVRHFLDKVAHRRGEEPKVVSNEVLDIFQRYSWPGNVRELENAVEAAAAVSQGDLIMPEDLPPNIRYSLPIGIRGEEGARVAAHERRSTESMIPGVAYEMPFKEAKEVFERAYFGKLLEVTRGNVSEVARRSGIDRRNVHLKIRKYGIKGDKRK